MPWDSSNNPRGACVKSIEREDSTLKHDGNQGTLELEATQQRVLVLRFARILARSLCVF